MSALNDHTPNEDDVLRRMLATKPTPHKVKEKGASKKPAPSRD